MHFFPREGSPWGHKELDTIKQLTHIHSFFFFLISLEIIS